MTTASQRKFDQPPPMTVEEFQKWPGDGTGRRYELVDGVLRAQDPASDAHGTIQGNLAIIIGNHVQATRRGCRIVIAPGIRPHLRARWNHRIPELAVTCAPNRPDGHMTPEPVLIVEVLSPSNAEDTWSNIPLYASLPSVQEILIVSSSEVAAELLRRGPDGNWPQDPEPIQRGDLIRLSSIGLDVPLEEAYRGTYLSEPGPS